MFGKDIIIQSTQLNGINTVGENIADNGGVRESYLAFQAFANKNKKMPLVPYMTKFTAEQLFFLSYANVSREYGQCLVC